MINDKNKIKFFKLNLIKCYLTVSVLLKSDNLIKI